jgi:pimeloyl-ACP methyl ester carboxylesterase
MRLVAKAAIATAIALSIGGGAVLAQEKPAVPGVSTIELDGRAVRVQAIGLQNRRDGQPIVVFEAGATNSLEVWGGIVSEAATLSPVVAYDRAGLGKSEWDEISPTPRHVADRLQRVLRQLGAAPPYVLVGYSWGGMLARYFAGYHPGDIRGLVLVDPAPMVTESLADNLKPFETIGAGRGGFDAYWSSFSALMAKASPAMRAEHEVMSGLLKQDLLERDLRPVPSVPIGVIVAGKYFSVPLQVPFDLQGHFQADLRFRLDVLNGWVLAAPRGTLVLAADRTHAILREDPGLVISTLRRVLEAATAGDR